MTWRAALAFAAATIVALPAQSTVTFLSAGAYALTSQEIDGAPPTVQYGPASSATSISPDDILQTRSDQSDAKFLAQVRSTAKSVAQFHTASSAQFLLLSSVHADALAHQPETYATSGTSVGYDFAVDTPSLLTLNIFNSATVPSSTGYLYFNVFSTNPLGLPTFIRSGYFAGDGAPSFNLAAGRYGLTLGAYSEGGTPGNSPFPVEVNAGVSATATLSIDSPALPPVGPAVPEPATWAMMMMGFGAVGAALRARARPSLWKIPPAPSGRCLRGDAWTHKAGV